MGRPSTVWTERRCGSCWGTTDSRRRSSPSSAVPTRTWAARSLTPASCQKASRSRLESVKGAYCHHFSSFWSSTGSWRPPQQAGTTGYSGHSGRSWMTSTLLMTWCSCHTTTDRCRKRTPAWWSYQLGQGSRSARRKQSWWRLTPLPTHH